MDHGTLKRCSYGCQKLRAERLQVSTEGHDTFHISNGRSLSALARLVHTCEPKPTFPQTPLTLHASQLRQLTDRTGNQVLHSGVLISLILHGWHAFTTAGVRLKQKFSFSNVCPGRCLNPGPRSLMAVNVTTRLRRHPDFCWSAELYWLSLTGIQAVTLDDNDVINSNDHGQDHGHPLLADGHHRLSRLSWLLNPRTKRLSARHHQKVLWLKPHVLPCRPQVLWGSSCVWALLGRFSHFQGPWHRLEDARNSSILVSFISHSSTEDSSFQTISYGSTRLKASPKQRQLNTATSVLLPSSLLFFSNTKRTNKNPSATLRSSLYFFRQSQSVIPKNTMHQTTGLPSHPQARLTARIRTRAVRRRHGVGGGAPANSGRRRRRIAAWEAKRIVFKDSRKSSFYPQNLLMTFFSHRKLQQNNYAATMA